MSLISLTDGWLINWSDEGGRLKEWVRDMNLTAINHGWFYALRIQPVHWFNNLCHIVSWIPILWSDRDWDYAYLWILMREKLRRMRECMGEDNPKMAKEIYIAETILGRLINDKYAQAEYDVHYAKYRSVLCRDEKRMGYAMLPTAGPDEMQSLRHVVEKEEAMRKSDSKFLGQWLTKHWFRWLT